MEIVRVFRIPIVWSMRGHPEVKVVSRKEAIEEVYAT